MVLSMEELMCIMRNVSDPSAECGGMSVPLLCSTYATCLLCSGSSAGAHVYFEFVLSLYGCMY